MNPQEQLIKFSIWVLAFLLTGIFSFIGGCVHRDHKYANEKLQAEKEARKEENKDANFSHRKMEQIAEDKILVSDAKKMVAEALAKHPQLIVGPDCTAKLEVTDPSKVNTDETLKKQTWDYKLSAPAVRLYDLSISTGDVELRGRINEAARETDYNSGFEIITENGVWCAGEVQRLKRLQERICEKQKTFHQPLSEYCVS